MDKQIANLIYYGMIIIVIAFCIFLFFYLTGEAKQCVADPIFYYTEKTNQLCFCNDGGGMFAEVLKK